LGFLSFPQFLFAYVSREAPAKAVTGYTTAIFSTGISPCGVLIIVPFVKHGGPRSLTSSGPCVVTNVDETKVPFCRTCPSVGVKTLLPSAR